MVQLRRLAGAGDPAQGVVTGTHAITGAAGRARTGLRIAGKGLSPLVIETAPCVALAGGDAGVFLQAQHRPEAGEDTVVLR